MDPSKSGELESDLTPEQLDHFRRAANPRRAAEAKRLAGMICDYLGEPDRPRRIVDLGGGDGSVLDHCLEGLPGAEGLLVDLAQVMLDANRPHPRKRLRLGNLADLDTALADEDPFDLMILNVVLHHCLADDAPSTRALQEDILRAAARRLAPGGTILVLEQVHESPIVPDLTPWLIYRLTRLRLLAPVVRRLGANTAGVGVLFASTRRLRRLFADAGLELRDEILFRTDGHSLALAAVGCRHSCQTLFALRSPSQPAT